MMMRMSIAQTTLSMLLMIATMVRLMMVLFYRAATSGSTFLG